MKESREYIPKDLQPLFVPYEIAWKLQHYNSKEEEVRNRGLFNGECIAFWNHYQEVHFNHTYDQCAIHLKAPMYSQVIDWFREKHKIYISISLDSYSEPYKLVPCIQIMDETLTYVNKQNYYGHFDNKIGYYEALNKAIEEALKLI